jgi:hypothetical protein
LLNSAALLYEGRAAGVDGGQIAPLAWTGHHPLFHLRFEFRLFSVLIILMAQILAANRIQNI